MKQYIICVYGTSVYGVVLLTHFIARSDDLLRPERSNKINIFTVLLYGDWTIKVKQG